MLGGETGVREYVMGSCWLLEWPSQEKGAVGFAPWVHGPRDKHGTTRYVQHHQMCGTARHVQHSWTSMALPDMCSVTR